MGVVSFPAPTTSCPKSLDVYISVCPYVGLAKQPGWPQLLGSTYDPCTSCLQVLQACHSYPRAVEVVVNTYEHIKSTSKWKAAIPEDVFEVRSYWVAKE